MSESKVDDKSQVMVLTMGALLALHAHESKGIARLYRRFKATFHEEISLPPARPISLKSRAKHKAAVLAAKSKAQAVGPGVGQGGVQADPSLHSRDLGAEQHQH